MVVTVHAFGNLRRFLPGGAERAALQLPEGITVKELVGYLKINPGEFWFATVGGCKVNDDYGLAEGEEVTLFSPVGGG